jgi:DHA2 family multidrug resistance protein
VTDEKPHLTGLPLILATIALSLATFLMVLDYSIANVSIPYIAGDLAVSADQGTYVITSFAVGSAILLPISGWITKRLGLIRTMALSVLGFTILSWVCGMAVSLPMLVVTRFFQGLAAGPMVPLSQSIIVKIFPDEKRNLALSFWSTIVVVAPILGPILGGWISYDFNWSWIFYINIPFGLFSAFVIHSVLKPFETKKEKMPTDWVGLLLLAVGVSTLQFLLDKGQQYDWLRSRLITTCVITSSLCFIFLIAWELLHRYPVLELKLLKIRSYALSLLFIGVSYAIYFGAVVLIPLWLQTNMGYTPIWAGLTVAPIGLMPFLFSGLMGKWVKKVGPIIPLFICFLLFALSSFDTAFLNTDVDLWHVAFGRFLLGFSLLFMIVPLFSLSLQDLDDSQLPSGTGMFHFVRAMSGGIGTSIFTTLWQRRSALHHSDLAATINPTNLPVEGLFKTLEGLHLDPEQQWAVTNDLINRQAAVLGINDCFWVMGWTFIGLTFFLLLGRKKKVSYNPTT